MPRLIFNGFKVDFYLKSYKVDLQRDIGTAGTFKAVSGKTHEQFRGYRRVLKAQLHDMETAELKEIFKAIYTTETVTITYNDIIDGLSTRTFTVNTLPAEFRFESDDERHIWTVPELIFTETEPHLPEGYG